jgi:hypothetical protein
MWPFTVEIVYIRGTVLSVVEKNWEKNPTHAITLGAVKSEKYLPKYFYHLAIALTLA